MGPIFFAALKDRSNGYLNTLLTVVASGMAKWATCAATFVDKSVRIYDIRAPCTPVANLAPPLPTAPQSTLPDPSFIAWMWVM